MRYYWYFQPRNFCNEYDLVYTTTPAAPGPRWERITLREANKLCAAERWRRRVDPAFSGAAPAVIYPADSAADPWDPRWTKKGYVMVWTGKTPYLTKEDVYNQFADFADCE